MRRSDAHFTGSAVISGSSMRHTVGTMPATVIFSRASVSTVSPAANFFITTSVPPSVSAFASRARPMRWVSGVVTR